jgi:S-adenosylmethionine hydrolase
MAPSSPTNPPRGLPGHRRGDPAAQAAPGGEAAWSPGGLVTLVTDFGQSDPYVGILKGVLLGRCAEARVVDLTHLIPPQDVRAAAWTLAHSWRWFPTGTVHLAVVDPGVGSARRILLAEAQGHAFLAPDNGLLGPVLPAGARVFALDVDSVSLDKVGHTFHGRDIFAPAAAALISGRAPAEMGAATDEWVRLDFPAPRQTTDGSWETEVLVVDRFGNLVTGLRHEHLIQDGDQDQETWTLEAAGREAPLRRTYAEAEEGGLLALENSFGYLELAIRNGNAATVLGLACGAPVRARRTSC